MRSPKSSRPFIRTAWFGLLLLPFLVLVNCFSPDPEKAPPGYNSVILGFEFVSDQGELSEVLTRLTETDKQDIDMLNYVDFGFMVAYSLFLYLFLRKLANVTHATRLRWIKWLVPIILLSDFIENLQLLQLSGVENALDASTHTPILILQVFTWIKWLTLAATLALAGFSLWINKQPFKWVGLVLLLPLILGVGAFISNIRSLENTFATSIFGAFFIIFVYCIIYRIPHPAENSKIL